MKIRNELVDIGEQKWIIMVRKWKNALFFTCFSVRLDTMIRNMNEKHKN